MKKILGITLALVMVLAFSAAALAADETNECPADYQIEMREAKGPLGEGMKGPGSMGDEEKLQQREQLREEMMADLPVAIAEELESNHEVMHEQMEANRELRQSIHDIMKELKDNDFELTDEIKDELRAYHDQIKDIHETVREDRGAVHDIIEDLDNLSEAEALDALAKIQEIRLATAEDVKEILQDMLEYVETL